MDRNIYVTSYTERNVLQKQYGLEHETFVNDTIGYDGSVWLLFARSVPERINGMFVDTEANTDYHALCLWVNWTDGRDVSAGVS